MSNFKPIEFPKLYTVDQVKELFRELFKKVEHGDDEHRKWLKDEIEEFIKTID